MAKRFADVMRSLSEDEAGDRRDSDHSRSDFAVEEDLEASADQGTSSRRDQRGDYGKSGAGGREGRLRDASQEGQEVGKTIRRQQEHRGSSEIDRPPMNYTENLGRGSQGGRPFPDVTKDFAKTDQLGTLNFSGAKATFTRPEDTNSTSQKLRKNEPADDSHSSNLHLDLHLKPRSPNNTTAFQTTNAVKGNPTLASHQRSPPGHGTAGSLPGGPQSADDQEAFIQDMKHCLRKLFNFYTSFANRLANFKMKLTQFLKLANDAGIVTRSLTPKKIQLQFISLNKSQLGMEYETFVRLLFALAQESFNVGDPNNNFRALLEQKVMPLYHQIYEETDLGVEDKILASRINVATLMIIHFRKDILLSIYSRYFPEEKNHTSLNLTDKALAKKSKQGLLNFLREFEILPSLLNIGIVNTFFLELTFGDPVEQRAGQSWADLTRTVDQDAGRVFTFLKFLFFLAKIAVYVFSDKNNIPKRFREIHFSADEKFYMLLERLEISQGFFDIAYGKYGKSAGTRLTLLSKELADLHKETSAFLNFEDFIDESDSSPWMILNFDLDVKGNKPKHALISKLVEQNAGKRGRAPREDDPKTLEAKPGKGTGPVATPEFEEAIGKFREELSKVFSHYATEASAKDQPPHMNCFRFINFLKDARIARAETADADKPGNPPAIPLKEADILFNSLTHNKPLPAKPTLKSKMRATEPVVTSKTISQEAFFKALEVLSKRLFPDLSLKRAFETLYFQYIFKHLSGGEVRRPEDSSKAPKKSAASEKMGMGTKYIEVLSQALKDTELLEFLQVVHKAVFPIFHAYSDENDLLSSAAFFAIFRDYEIFPAVIPKVKLEGVFEALSIIFQGNPELKGKEKPQADAINEHLFVESFIMIAHDCRFNLKTDPSAFQKITYLLHLMNESQGFRRTMQQFPTFQKYDLVGRIRKNFPSYFLV